MPVVTPLSKDRAAEDVKPIFDDLTKRFGRMPNIFATMANRPNALKHFLALDGAIMTEGTVEPRLKELAYLKVSTVNGCEY